MSVRDGNLPSRTPAVARVDALGVTTISSHHRRRLADGKQQVPLLPIRTELVSTKRCVPHAPLRAVSTIEGA